tara:strand:+ start:97 stop:315 length:219 start_codon:yes stop_codon:yes gene_type:complete
MKDFILNIKNLTPYLLLIAIYFFFVNIEARNSQNINQNNKILLDNEKEIIEESSDINFYNRTIEIPVIPYKK